MRTCSKPTTISPRSWTCACASAPAASPPPRLLDAKPGECDLSPWLEAVGHGPGLLVLDGLVAVTPASPIAP